MITIYISLITLIRGITILDVSVNEDSPIPPLEVDREGPELSILLVEHIYREGCSISNHSIYRISPQATR